MYFVVRTDVAADDGRQRVFGAYDTKQQALGFIATLQQSYIGVFAVYFGEAVA